MNILMLLFAFFGITIAENAINQHVCHLNGTTLSCLVAEGNEYSPDRMLRGIKTLEIIGKFKGVTVNELMPDLMVIKLTESCSTTRVKVPEGVEVQCQGNETEMVQSRKERQTREEPCGSILLDEVCKMQMKMDTMMTEITTLKTEINMANIMLKSCQNLEFCHGRGPAAQTDHVAFTAFHSETVTTYGPWATIIFDQVDSNVGQAYNPVTGMFTCPFTGYYYFTHSALSTHLSHIETEIVLEGVPKAMVYAESNTPSSTPGSGYDQGSNSAVLHCEAGQRVWVRILGDRGKSLYWERYTQFSGFKLWTV